MIRVEIDETIDGPIDEVFARLVDIARYPEWMSDDGLFVTCRQDTDGPVRVGTAYTDVTTLGAVRGKVAALEPPREVVFHYEARLLGMTVLEGWPGYTLEPLTGARTRVHHVAEARLNGPFMLLRPLIRRMARKERRLTVESLRDSFVTETAPR